MSKELASDNVPAARAEPGIDQQRRTARPVKMRRNIFGVSEAAIAKPESSPFAAEGKMRPSNEKTSSGQDIPSRRNSDYTVSEPADSKTTSNPVLGAAAPPKESIHEAGLDKDPALLDTGSKTEEVSKIASDEDIPTASEQNQIVESVPTPNRKQSEVISLPPDILVHAPSDPTPESQSSALGTPPTASVSSAAIRSVPQNSPVLSSSALPGNDLSRVIPSIAEKLAQAPNVVQAPALPNLGAVEQPIDTLARRSKKKKMVKRARKALVRKRILALLLGRQLGAVTHAQLRQVSDAGGSIPVPINL